MAPTVGNYPAFIWFWNLWYSLTNFSVLQPKNQINSFCCRCMSNLNLTVNSFEKNTYIQYELQDTKWRNSITNANLAIENLCYFICVNSKLNIKSLLQMICDYGFARLKTDGTVIVSLSFSLWQQDNHSIYL